MTDFRIKYHFNQLTLLWPTCGVKSRIVSSAGVNVLPLAPQFIQSRSGFPKCSILAEGDVRLVGHAAVIGYVTIDPSSTLREKLS